MQLASSLHRILRQETLVALGHRIEI